ncbi:hypothetical protein MTO98_26520 [Mucilaginibacter sp. SMC90]|uniref:hypothetical protein n=1 Tax=Mucilaginibacter sp. SMC90 TaxID=2929803 RepID=UPI001FB381B5|nr:hypothetical protein [Mucilaginibacter sp. SMC90]UOE47969.1 hypothetical protein MTO98_26520 [Mucilaginibacter sp. SMC90]
MNRYDFTQPGGFPFDQGVMEFIQDCINTAASTAALSGSLAILSGCTVAGGSVSNGVVVINGEILPFIGGVISAKVIIQETATAIAYQDGTPRTVKYQRAAKFGDDGVSNNQWTNFKRNTAEGVLARLDRVEGLLRPFSGAGGMVWWKGSIASIPAGWREVNEWRGKFPMHAKAPNGDGVRPDGFDVGDTGGAETHTLTKEEIPEFKINVATTGYANIQGAGEKLVGHANTPNAPDIQITVNAGGGAAHPILNPYGVGCWIEPIPEFFN